MSPAMAGQALTLVILGVVAGWNIYADVQELFIRRRTRDSLRTLLESSNEDWASTHRLWLENRRTNQELKLSRDALLDVVCEECEGWHDNMVDSPDPKRAA